MRRFLTATIRAALPAGVFPPAPPATLPARPGPAGDTNRGPCSGGPPAGTLCHDG
jgi:hypothetical protein